MDQLIQPEYVIKCVEWFGNAAGHVSELAVILGAGLGGLVYVLLHRGQGARAEVEGDTERELELEETLTRRLTRDELAWQLAPFSSSVTEKISHAERERLVAMVDERRALEPKTEVLSRVELLAAARRRAMQQEAPIIDSAIS